MKLLNYLGEGNLSCCCEGSWENYLDQSVSKIIIIILSLRVGTSTNKNIDHRGKETCAYVSNHISFLHDSSI